MQESNGRWHLFRISFRIGVMETVEIAKKICRKLRAEGYIAYFAGGWVRDFLLGHPSADIDIATNAPLDEVVKMFPKTTLVGLAFGVVIVQEEGFAFEVAAFRKDLSYSNGRRPDGIEPSTPEEDAERRDFTINGIFYDPLDGQIYDFIGGKEDLKKGVIRAIGNPHERFVEDRLRMIRAVRFSSRFGFPIEAETRIAIQKSAPTLFPAVAKERIYQEFIKMEGLNFIPSLIELKKLSLLDEIFPSLKEVTINDFQSMCASIPDNIPMVAKLRELLKKFPYDIQIQELSALKLSSKEIELIDYLYLAEISLRNKAFSTPSEWARFYAHPSSEVAVSLYGDKEVHENRQALLKEAIERLRQKRPVVTSQHLLEKGIKPGREMGELLKRAETVAIDNNLTEPDKVLEYLKRDHA